LKTVLNYRMIAIGCVKWEKFACCFRRSIHQRRGKYIVIKYICPRAVRHGETKCMKCLRWGKFCDVAFVLFVFSRITFRRRTKKTVWLSLTFVPAHQTHSVNTTSVKHNICMRRITTFRSRTDPIHDGGLVII
jgi:hypothetical protein